MFSYYTLSINVDKRRQIANGRRSRHDVPLNHGITLRPGGEINLKERGDFLLYYSSALFNGILRVQVDSLLRFQVDGKDLLKMFYSWRYSAARFLNLQFLERYRMIGLYQKI